MPVYEIDTSEGTFELDVSGTLTPEAAQQIIAEHLASQGKQAGASAKKPEPSMLRKGAAFAARVGGPIVGGAAGAALGPVSAASGAAAGGVLGEAAAEYILGENMNPEEQLVAGITSAIPAGPAARLAERAGVSFGKQVALHALEGATQGALATGVDAAMTDRELTPESLLAGTAGGAVLGGTVGTVAGAAASRYRRATNWAAADALGLTKEEAQAAKAAASSAEDVLARAEPGVSDTVPAVRPVVVEHTVPSAGASEATLGTEGTATRQTRTEIPGADVNPGDFEVDASGKWVRVRGLSKAPAETPPMSAADRADRMEGIDAWVDRVYHDVDPATVASLKTYFRENPDVVERQTRGRQSIARMRDLSRTISFDPEDIMPAGTVVNGEQLMATTDLVETLHASTMKVAQESLTNPNDKMLGQRLEDGYNRFVNAALSLTGFRSELGRGLRVLREKSGGISPAARVVRFAGQAKKFGATADDIKSALQRAGDDPLKQYNELLNLARSDWKTKARSLYITNLLTNPKTMERNFFGNTIALATDVAMRPVAGALDAVKSAATGKEREVYAGETVKMLLAGKKSLPQAFKAFTEVMRQGYSSDQALRGILDGKFDIRPEPFDTPILNTIPRILEGTDVFFRLLATSMHRDAAAYSEARTIATRSGLTGKALRNKTAELAAELAANPTDKMLTEIEELAARSVFRERTSGPITKAAHALREIPVVGPMVLPFISTPANIMRRGFGMTPAGFGMVAARKAGRQGTMAQAEAAFGSLAVLPLVYWASRGNITGSAPTDAGERDRFLAERPENSIRVGDTWYKYTDLGPAAIPISLVANFVQRFKSAGKAPTDMDALELVSQAAFSMKDAGSSMFDASYFSGLKDFLDAMDSGESGDRKVTKFLTQRGLSAVPGQGLLRQATAMTDPYLRAPGDSWFAQLQAIVPNQSQKVAPRLDAFGQPIKRPETGLGALTLPDTQPARREDPVRAELARLGMTPDPPRPKAELKIGTLKVAISPEDDLVLRAARGQAYRYMVAKVMDSPSYAGLSDDVKEKYLRRLGERAVRSVNDRAKVYLRTRRPFDVPDLVKGIIPSTE